MRQTTPTPQTDPTAHPHGTGLAALTLGAIGIVYGDIGTSPLYTMKEVFGGHHLAPTPENILGILSLIFWSLILVVSFKYVLVILRADNQGEGGILALTALAQRHAPLESTARRVIFILGLAGAALFFGDSLITPAISVLSAVEGLGIATHAFEPFIVPIALGVLIGLFAVQSRGTHRVGRWFGPIMLIWFASLGVLGLLNLLRHPDVLWAVNPLHALTFFAHHGVAGFLVLGAVVLAITGAEALYADMGHFGRRPIQYAWFGFVLPTLLLNYFGQGALLLANPEAARNPFYLLAPDWALYPMVALATAATIIASQAVISGAFSVGRALAQMGYAPRLVIRHTSETASGQIYMPFINWALMVGVVLLVLGFQSSSNLAAAYGIAVTGNFATTTLLAFLVLRLRWELNLAQTLLGLTAFLAIDLAFFGANAVKIPEGGWFPLLTAALVFTILTTWKRGRDVLARRLGQDGLTMPAFLESININPPARVPGTAVFMTTRASGVPRALLHNLAHNKILHEQVVLATVVTENVPYVPAYQRMEVTDLGQNFYRVNISYGFQESPDIPSAMADCPCGMRFELMETTFFFSRETLIPSREPGMALWRETLFAFLTRNATSPMSFFRIPPNRVVELGAQVEI
jgi:KUP system potassium uptake protein